LNQAKAHTHRHTHTHTHTQDNIAVNRIITILLAVFREMD